MTDDLDGQCTQLMVFRIGQCLRGSNHDRLARMDAQRVEVLHVTHGDAVVVAVAHYLIFDFLPALQTLLHQHLRGERESLLGQFIEFLLIVTETRSETTQSVGSTQDDGIAQLGSGLTGLGDILASLTLDGLHTDLVEFLHEEFTVFRIHNGLHGRT